MMFLSPASYTSVSPSVSFFAILSAWPGFDANALSSRAPSVQNFREDPIIFLPSGRSERRRRALNADSGRERDRERREDPKVTHCLTVSDPERFTILHFHPFWDALNATPPRHSRCRGSNYDPLLVSDDVSLFLFPSRA